MAHAALSAVLGVFQRQGFMLRWVAAVAVSIGLVSWGQYALASRQLEQRLLSQAAADFETHLAELEDPLIASTSPAAHGEAARAVDHIAVKDGVLYVGVFDAQGQELAATTPQEEDVDPEILNDVLSSQRAVVEKESDHGEREAERYEFFLPMTTSQGVMVMKIDQRSGIIGQVLTDLQERELLGLLAIAFFAVPLSYLLGGRKLRRQYRAADLLSATDELTGIPGRRPFRPLLNAALTDTSNESVSLAIIDIDHFKSVNDTLGHSYGDRVLVALAQSFDVLRASDTAFRLGGDEFAIVLPDTGARDTAEILDRVRVSLAGRVPSVTISSGVASVTYQEAVSAQEMWERADAALYQAKQLGRNRTVAFSQLTHGLTVAPDKVDAVQGLCSSKTGCSIVFQPIWDLSQGCILGHEALLRLPTNLALSGPAEAFEIADRLGLAGELDVIARTEVLRAVKDMRWAGGLLFINVHPAALREFDFPAFAAEVTAAGLSHTDIVLELTEQADLDNASNLRALKRASACGFKLALDDLGAGNAGLRALSHAQFHVIKLDRGVTSRLGIDPAADAVLAAAASFVRGTGGWVVAEGIEDTAQLDAVLAESTGRAPTAPPMAGQGYLLGYPLGKPQAMDKRLDVLDHPTPDILITAAHVMPKA